MSEDNVLKNKKNMKKTTNTQQKEVHLDWLFGFSPSSIENQEERGQQELVSSQQLPRKCNSPHGVNAAEQYAKMGIKVFTKSKGDDLFIGVSLPDGWEKKATDHSMWNNLIDNRGRIRATFFYKAAFYDRDSFINFETRYQAGCEYFENEKNPNRDWDSARVVYVVDKNTGEKIWNSPKHFYEEQEKQYNAAREWLNKTLPEWQDINAYW